MLVTDKTAVVRLTVIPANRPTPKEMLQHPWLIENMKKEVPMARWMREVWDWKKKSSKRDGYSDVRLAPCKVALTVTIPRTPQTLSPELQPARPRRRWLPSHGLSSTNGQLKSPSTSSPTNVDHIFRDPTFPPPGFYFGNRGALRRIEQPAMG